MNELIDLLTTNVGIDKAVAEKTIGIILGFLRNEGPTEDVSSLIAAIPGGEDAVTDADSGGLMGGGLMALGSKLMGLGLGMGEIQSVAGELFKYGRDKIGAEKMGNIISQTPGLSQFA